MARGGFYKGVRRNGQGNIVLNLPLNTANMDGVIPTLPNGTAMTFTRASNAYGTKNDGTLTLLSSNQPRINSTGYLAEGASTNLILQSQTFDSATWAKTNSGSTSPVVTANVVNAPDGTLTADQVDFGSTASASSYTLLNQSFTATAVPYTASVWLRCASGTLTTYLMFFNGVTYKSVACAVTTSWQRFILANQTLSATTWYMMVGGSRVDGTQVAQPAQTVYAWGSQTELGAFATSNIVTVAATVTRAADVLSFPAPSNWPVGTGRVTYSMTPQWTAPRTNSYGLSAIDVGGTQGFRFRFLTNATAAIGTADGTTGSEDASGVQTWAIGTTYDLNYSWGGGARVVLRNGTSIVSTSSKPMPTGTITPVYLGVFSDGTAGLDGYLKNIIVSSS